MINRHSNECLNDITSNRAPELNGLDDSPTWQERACFLGQRIPGYIGRSSRRKFRRGQIRRALQAFEFILARMGPGDIAIDAGAHFGSVTEKMARTGAEVHAFEPDSENFSVLSERVSHLMSQGLMNIVLHNAAVAGYTGEATLFRPEHYIANTNTGTEGCTIFSESKYIGYNAGDAVEVVDFAQFLRDLSKPAKLVKLDIEGAEWEVLKVVEKRALDRFEHMFVETHEWLFPEFQRETAEMKARYAVLKQPYINLFWP